MADEAFFLAEQETSPRSTILVASAPMTTVLAASMNGSKMASGVASSDGTLPTPSKDKDTVSSNDDLTTTSVSKGKGVDGPELSRKGDLETVHDSTPQTPIPHEYSFRHYANHTPQQATGYYLGYAPHQQHMIPEPVSPGQPHNAMYEGLSFFQPHSFHPAPAGSSFLAVQSGVGNPPLSPLRGPTSTVTMTGLIPPASPLFPRMSSVGGLDGNNGQHRGSSNLTYMVSSQLGMSNSNNYQTHPSVVMGSHSSDDGAWGFTGDSRYENQNGYPSPQISEQGMQMLYGMPMTRDTSGGRAYSFDESIPLSALDDQANPAYSPYGGGSQTSPGGATLFAHQPSWGYGGPPDPYNAPSSPLQPRPSAHPQLGMYPPSPGSEGMRGPMGPYGQFFPASSPGPPIQTTASNKGPDGANLFIFHIPNHFTNLDMYQLFTPYGNLLSVRIMVERDTGRSRGFGFVSYDTSEAAAMAIKELNGFAIGNKRLKVQHKQIRRGDSQDQDSLQDSFSGGNYQRYPSLPPSGPNANQQLWFDTARSADQDDDESPEHQLQEHDDGHDDELDDTSPQRGEIGDSNNDDYHEQASPLANLSQLQNALPEIPGNVTPV